MDKIVKKIHDLFLLSIVVLLWIIFLPLLIPAIIYQKKYIDTFDSIKMKKIERK